MFWRNISPQSSGWKTVSTLGSQWGCISWCTGKRAFCSGISIVMSIFYRQDIADKLLLCWMWWLASHRGQQCKICVSMMVTMKDAVFWDMSQKKSETCKIICKVYIWNEEMELKWILTHNITLKYNIHKRAQCSFYCISISCSWPDRQALDAS
jgi:hypothetical protein